MKPYYPARDGYPSMFESEDIGAAAVGEQVLHRSFVDRPLANQFPAPRRSSRQCIVGRAESRQAAGHRDSA